MNLRSCRSRLRIVLWWKMTECSCRSRLGIMPWQEINEYSCRSKPNIIPWQEMSECMCLSLLPIYSYPADGNNSSNYDHMILFTPKMDMRGPHRPRKTSNICSTLTASHPAKIFLHNPIMLRLKVAFFTKCSLGSARTPKPSSVTIFCISILGLHSPESTVIST